MKRSFLVAVGIFETLKIKRCVGYIRRNLMKPTRYLSVKEVAEILNISSKTVYKKLDVIPGYFNLGGMHFFDAEELQNGLKRLATSPKKTASQFHQGRVNRHGLVK
jgi:excisionase family DNA binding protein